MNPLHNETLTWVGDGLEGSTLTQTGNDLVIASKSTGTPFNVRLDTEKAAQDYYLQVSITSLKGHLSIGAVKKDEFKSGWKGKGMFYNGNLTNAGAALKTDWGPRFAVGDSLGIRVAHGDALEVAFYKNGKSLGTGFKLAGNTTTYYPCLHISGFCSVSVEIPEQLPSTALQGATATGFFGTWKMDKAWDGEKSVAIPDGRPLQLILGKDKVGGLTMSCKIGNSLNGQVKVLEETETSMTVETGPFMMTMMMPPPQYRAMENLISMKAITKMDLEENTKLTLSGPEMKVECSRLARTPEALTKY